MTFLLDTNACIRYLNGRAAGVVRLVLVATIALTLVACHYEGGRGLDVTPEGVVAALEFVGAEAINPTKMTVTDYGLTPFLCEGTKFDVPSSNSSGSFYICQSESDADKIAEFYEKAGEMGELFAQRVYRNDYAGLVLQLPQVGIDDAVAAKYERAVYLLSE